MCNAQRLAHGSDGYIIRCGECRRMQVAFGTAAISIDETQFFQLKEKLHTEMQYAQYSFTQRDTKQVSIDVNATAMWCLTINELVALNELVDQAHALLEVYHILEKPMPWEN